MYHLGSVSGGLGTHPLPVDFAKSSRTVICINRIAFLLYTSSPQALPERTRNFTLPAPGLTPHRPAVSLSPIPPHSREIDRRTRVRTELNAIGIFNINALSRTFRSPFFLCFQFSCPGCSKTREPRARSLILEKLGTWDLELTS